MPYPASVVGLLVMFENATLLALIPVNALPSIAGKAPVNAPAFIVPATPSIKTVGSSATTVPISSPSNFPVNVCEDYQIPLYCRLQKYHLAHL